jgi:hypothetical protein
MSTTTHRHTWRFHNAGIRIFDEIDEEYSDEITYEQFLQDRRYDEPILEKIFAILTKKPMSKYIRDICCMALSTYDMATGQTEYGRRWMLMGYRTLDFETNTIILGSLGGITIYRFNNKTFHRWVMRRADKACVGDMEASEASARKCVRYLKDDRRDKFEKIAKKFDLESVVALLPQPIAEEIVEYLL